MLIVFISNCQIISNQWIGVWQKKSEKNRPRVVGRWKEKCVIVRMAELLALRLISVWAFHAMLCESVCVISSTVLVHYLFLLALTLMLREWKSRYACVLSSLSALYRLMGVFGIMYKIFFMFWSVFAYLQECINTRAHTQTRDLHLETWRIKLRF